MDPIHALIKLSHFASPSLNQVIPDINYLLVHIMQIFYKRIKLENLLLIHH